MPSSLRSTAPLDPRAPRALRAWQQAALARYRESSPRDFLAVATPGAGKTTFALQVAQDLLREGVVQALTVVTPTDHLKRQWHDAGEVVGIDLDHRYRNTQGAAGADWTGVCVTYAQVAALPALHRARTERRRTLVVLDEIHHGGDALSWGDAIREAFEPATRRLSLTGTPFRSDTSPIPFVTYAPDADGARRSVADHSYGYGPALADGVVRPVLFLTYAGETRWRTRAGDEVAARLGQPLTKDMVGHAWRTALDPSGAWMSAVLRAADRRLTRVRQQMPDAAGLVIATDQATARAYAGVLRQITGESPTVVLSDDPDASRRIGRFSVSADRWMVAVRMVSEGVDVPRLAVGVYATSASTPLFFAQAVGRFVRARGRGETASVFLPSVPQLTDLAAAMEAERDHVLDRRKRTGDDVLGEDGFDDQLLAEANRTDSTGDLDDGIWEALESSAELDRVIYDGTDFGQTAMPGSVDEEEYLGLPGLLEPDQVSELLRQRHAKQRAREKAHRKTQPAHPPQVPEPSTEHLLASLRKELNGLVGAYHHQTGKPHGQIHADLRAQSGGGPLTSATAAQLQRRVALIRRWGG